MSTKLKHYKTNMRVINRRTRITTVMRAVVKELTQVSAVVPGEEDTSHYKNVQQ